MLLTISSLLCNFSFILLFFFSFSFFFCFSQSQNDPAPAVTKLDEKNVAALVILPPGKFLLRLKLHHNLERLSELTNELQFPNAAEYIIVCSLKCHNWHCFV